MRLLNSLLFFLMLLAGGTPAARAQAPAAPPTNPVVALETTEGTILLELYPSKAPITVKNFLAYVEAGHYIGTTFHRAVPGFMIQGGGFTPDMKEKPAGPTIKNEAANGLKNERGAVAMARRAAPDSGDSQFFINLKDNDFLNHKDDTPADFGYAVFGRVISGMDVVDKIAKVPTATRGAYENVPVEPVLIQTAKVVELQPRTAVRAPAPRDPNNPVVVLDTSLGKIQIELYPRQAPVTVANFLAYVRAKHYDGLIVHRVTPDLVIQTGGLFADLTEKPAGPTIKNEAANGLKNERGAVAMARRAAPDSGDSQFFINLKDNDFLNHKDDTPADFGHAVFGRVISGMDVVDKIAKVPTVTKGPHQNVPVEPLVVHSATLLSPSPAAKPVRGATGR